MTDRPRLSMSDEAKLAAWNETVRRMKEAQARCAELEDELTATRANLADVAVPATPEGGREEPASNGGPPCCGWRGEYAELSKRLDRELARNVEPRRHDFIDDPHHTDQCRQAVFDGARRCCGYPASAHRHLDVAEPAADPATSGPSNYARLRGALHDVRVECEAAGWTRAIANIDRALQSTPAAAPATREGRADEGDEDRCASPMCEDCGGPANGPGDAECVNCDCGAVVCSACCEAFDGESYCRNCAIAKLREALAAHPSAAPAPVRDALQQALAAPPGMQERVAERLGLDAEGRLPGAPKHEGPYAVGPEADSLRAKAMKLAPRPLPGGKP